MNFRILCLLIFLLNIYFIFGEVTLVQQCIDIKTFMLENNKIIY